jgi:nucleotide-binding universal stress UspA family protein
MFKKILVATHGTEGAKNAESYAINLAREFGAELHGLYVIHKGWSSLVGIEWLHPSSTRMEFYKYAEAEFIRRAEEVLDALREHSTGIEITTSIRVSEPAEAIAEEARDRGGDLIVIGNGSNRRSEEYKAKVSLKKLVKLAPCPVLVANNDSNNFIKRANYKKLGGFHKGDEVPLMGKGGDVEFRGANKNQLESSGFPTT